MQKNGIPSRQSFDGALRESLSTIKEIQAQLHLQNGTCKTAAGLTSQIELCDILLAEISCIHDSLAERLKNTRSRPQLSSHASLHA
jgi:hypothetical protein